MSLTVQQQQQRAADRDRNSSILASCMLVATLLYNASVATRLAMKGCERRKGILGMCWVLAHLLLETAFGHMAAGKLYARHRTALLMITRTGLLLLMVLYVPQTFEHTLELEQQAGRAEAVTCRMLIAFVAVHAMEVSLFRLPARLALPYHTARLLLGFMALPATLRAFAAAPALEALACRAWEDVGSTYATIAAHVLGPAGDGGGGGGDGAAAAASCGQRSVLALLVYLQISFGVLVPLYLVALWDARDLRGWLRAGEPGSRTDSGGGGSSGSGGGGSSGSGSDAGARAMSGDAVSSAAQLAWPGHQQLHRTNDGVGPSSSSGGRAGTSAAAAGSSTGAPPLLQRQSAQGNAGGEDPAATAARAQHHAHTEPGLGDAWPRHFLVVMHASVLVAATGLVWVAAGLGAGFLDSSPHASWLLGQR